MFCNNFPVEWKSLIADQAPDRCRIRDGYTMTPQRYRTIFISDLHIGSTQCQADVLLDFLKFNESEALYLVGDIIDFWALSKKVYWPKDHNTIIQKILRKARHDTRVVYVPGNHDENVREYDDHVFGDIEVRNSAIHQAADGRRYLVVHGDEYDTIARYHRWVARLGSASYEILLKLNRWIRTIRRVLGIQSNFSLSAYVKFKVKNAVQFISDYERSIVQSLAHEGVDGVICGHIHHAEIKSIGDFIYANTGDFVESCTAIVEHFDGRMELIRWGSDLRD